MKKLLIPIVTLLAFSTLSTSVSAPLTDYYWISFYGEASGSCMISEAAQSVLGKGSVHVRGSAIARRNQTYQGYWVHRFPLEPYDPNTRLWTRRTYMTASWNNEKINLFMWPSYMFLGWFNDTLDWFYMYNLNYYGYYRGDAGLQFIIGRADVFCLGSPIPYLEVILYIDATPWISFTWLSAEYLDYPVAKSFIQQVTVWGPIPWHPSGP